MAAQPPVSRTMFRFRVRPDRLAEYGRRHGEVWPDMLRALRDSGWENYSIFTAPDGQVVGYFESRDPDAARAGMALREVNARWQAEMAEFFDGAGPDETMTELTEVFHLETQLAAAEPARTQPAEHPAPHPDDHPAATAGDAARTSQD